LKNYEHNADLNRDLDKFGIKLIKIVGTVGIIWGLFILIAFGLLNGGIKFGDIKCN
jgi:hypothetical protein